MLIGLSITQREIFDAPEATKAAMTSAAASRTYLPAMSGRGDSAACVPLSDLCQRHVRRVAGSGVTGPDR